jgi:8-oxo-dGTP pyrophosphatase MutT (NUDIX family)
MTSARPALRRASVLIPLYRDAAGALRVIMLRRAPGGIHGGQLAFPGGRPEPTDASPFHTAMREAEEEIGLAPGRVHLLAALPRLETFTSGYVIAPFLARIEPPDAWRPEPREVAAVLDLRLDDLARPETRGEVMEQLASWPEPRRIEFFKVGGERLWGLSYRILAPLVPRLLAGEWKV